MMPEKKFWDTALSFAIDETGEVPATGQLCLIPQGDTENTRDGRKCTVESVQIRARAIFAPGAASGATITHVYLIQDTQCNGAAAAAGDVFVNAANPPVASTNFTSGMLNLTNSGRFRILKHWVHNWNSQAGVTTAYNNVEKQIEFFKKCKIPLQFSSTTGALTEIKSNNLFLMAGNSGADDLVSWNGTCRLRFRG